MRLVCDKCSAVHTIEDRLVGERDFRVSCKECGTPIVVRSAHQVPSERPPLGLGLPPLKAGDSVRPSAPRQKAPGARQRFGPAGGETWFVSLGGEQLGPYTAGEFSRLLEQERLDWTTPVWRDGLKDWRPARRDAVLVTSVAGARGHAGDTMRLNSSRSFLAPEDTVVDLRPKALHPSSPQPIATAPVLDDLLSSNSDTQTIDARLGIPQLTPSARPAAWSSAENASFRAGLGMPADSILIQKAAGTEQSASAAALGESLRSAPGVLRGAPRMESTAELDLATHAGPSGPVAGEGFFPKPQSMLTVAAMAFAAGVVVAAASSYFGKESDGAAGQGAPAAAPPQAPAEVTPTPLPLPSTESLRELPDPEELRAEVRHVAPDVKRCVDDPALGVDVDIYLDGPSGRVRDVDVRSPALPPGRVQCVSHAVRQMQLVPFTRPELKLMHKFSW